MAKTNTKMAENRTNILALCTYLRKRKNKKETHKDILMKNFLMTLSATACVAISLTTACQSEPAVQNPELSRAAQTLDSLYTHYSVEGSCLLRENYPSGFGDYTATYLATQPTGGPNPFSYLWPYSGSFSAVNALLEATGDSRYKDLLEQRVLPGLEEYRDTRRQPEAYASYIHTAPQSDRFYDDNIWLGIDFTDLYTQCPDEKKYLQKAQTIWKFIESGMDEQLGGGIYWCEQKKESKNTCSNAPASVFALKLFRATQDSSYLAQGKALYEWTQTHLQDTTDYLYFDNMALDGKIGYAKFAYNSGQMMQAAALLHQITGQPKYLTDAQNLAKACYNYFFCEYTPEGGQPFRLLKKGDVWFTAVMLRGFIELWKTDHNPEYLAAFHQSLDYAWNHARDEQGLFNTDFSGKTQDSRKWLLTQAAMIEMYARLAEFTQENTL